MTAHDVVTILLAAIPLAGWLVWITHPVPARQGLNEAAERVEPVRGATTAPSCAPRETAASLNLLLGKTPPAPRATLRRRLSERRGLGLSSHGRPAADLEGGNE